MATSNSGDVPVTSPRESVSAVVGLQHHDLTQASSCGTARGLEQML